MTLVMYDTITVDDIPANPPAVAGYVGGKWPTYNELTVKFPKAQHLDIAVNSSERARCLDVEPGDATDSQAAWWYSHIANHGKGKVVFYTSASNIQALINALNSAGITRDKYLIWSAHYTFNSHICAPGVCGYPQADGTQWTDKSHNTNLDESLLSDHFFAATSPPPVAKATGIARFAGQLNLDTGEWQIHGQPGIGVKFDKREFKAEVTVQRGAWTVKGN